MVKLQSHLKLLHEELERFYVPDPSHVFFLSQVKLHNRVLGQPLGCVVVMFTFNQARWVQNHWEQGLTCLAIVDLYAAQVRFSHCVGVL